MVSPFLMRASYSPVSIHHQVPPKTGTVWRPHVNALRPPRNAVILFKSPIDFRRPTGWGHEHFIPRAIRGGENKLPSSVLPTGVRDHGEVIRGCERPNVAQLGEPSTPGDVRLPDIDGVIFP